MKYKPPFNETNENAVYKDFNLETGEAGSIPPAAAIEHPMREILSVITGAGLTPSDTDLTQLKQAINALIAPKANSSDVNAALATKANMEDVNATLATKANMEDVNAVLATKASLSDGIVDHTTEVLLANSGSWGTYTLLTDGAVIAYVAGNTSYLFYSFLVPEDTMSRNAAIGGGNGGTYNIHILPRGTTITYQASVGSWSVSIAKLKGSNHV